MSRAFVTDKEDWVYCAKAGERCLHASADRDCRRTDCQYYDRVATAPEAGPMGSQQGVKVVRRESKAGQNDHSATPGAAKSAKKATQLSGHSPSSPATHGRSAAGTQGAGARPTKKAKIKPPRKWGGRSG